MTKYRAFISYRHRPLDIAAAKAVQAKLETFRIPSYISKKDGIKKLGRCFRDQDELPTSSNLADSIVNALENSEWLIVICTPALSESKWCLTEIETFIKLHGRDRVLAVLAEGEPQESFPSLLRFETLDDGMVIEREPLAADIRGQMNKKLRTEKLRLIAPMLGVGFDDLRRRARERFMKTVVAASIVGAVFFAGFGGITLMQSNEIARQRDIAQQNEERAIAGEAEAKTRGDEVSAKQAQLYADFAYGIKDSNPAGAAMLALKALEYGTIDGRVLPDVRIALHYVAGFWDYTTVSEKPEYHYMHAGSTAAAPANTTRGKPIFNGDGSTFMVSAETSARLYDMKTMKVIREYDIATESVYTKKMNDGYEYNLILPLPRVSAGKTKAIVPYTEPFIIDTTSGEVLHKGPLTEDMLDEFRFPRYILASDKETNNGRDVLYDRVTGEVKAEWQGGTVEIQQIKMHSIYQVPVIPDNSRYLALEEKKADGNNNLQIYEMPEMKLIYSLELPETAYIFNYFFSPDEKHLVIILEGHLDPDYYSVKDYTSQYIILRLEDCQIIADYTVDSNNRVEAMHHSRDIENYFSPDGMKVILPYKYPLEERAEKGDTVMANIFDLTTGGFIDNPLRDYYYIYESPISFTPDGSQVFYYERSGKKFVFYDAGNGALLDTAYLNMEHHSNDIGIYMSGDAEAILVYHPAFADTTFLPDVHDQYTCDLYYLTARDEVDYMSHIRDRQEAVDKKTQDDIALVEKLVPSKYPLYGDCKIGVNGTKAMITDAYHAEVVDMSSGKTIFDEKLTYSIKSDTTGYKRFDLRDISASTDRFIIGQLDTLFYYDAANGSLLYEKRMGLGRLRQIGISPDGEVIFVLSDKGELVFLHAEDGSEIARQYYNNLEMKNNDIKLQFTPDSRYIYGDKGISENKGVGSYMLTEGNRIKDMGAKDGILLFDAKTGEFAASFLADPIPASLQPKSGEIIYLNDTYTLRIPPIEETIAAVREIAREYEFKQEDRLRYYLD